MTLTSEKPGNLLNNNINSIIIFQYYYLNMHLIEKKHIRMCLNLLYRELEDVIRSNTKTQDTDGNFASFPRVNINAAIRDLLRYEAHIDLLREATKDLFHDD